MRKRKIMLTFATAFVFLFNFQFSYAEDAKVTREVTDLATKPVQFQTVRTIEMKQNKPAKLNLPVKDKDIVVVIDNSEKVVPEEEPKDSPFSYALFAGAEKLEDQPSSDVFMMNANKIDIEGACHSNGNINGGVGAGSSLSGEYSAPGNVNVTGDCISVEKSKDKEMNKIIPMPDLSGKFAVNAQGISKSYFSNNSLDPETGKTWWDGIRVDEDGRIRNDFGEDLKCSVADGKTEEDFDTWSLGGAKLELKKDFPLFFDGNVIFSLDSISGNGFIIATGSITLSNEKSTDLGLKYNADGTVDEENSAELGFYSVDGDIQFNLGEGVKFKGLIYSPGKLKKDGKPGGRVQVNSKYFELYGSMVASRLTIDGDKKIHYTKTDLHKEVDDGDKDDPFHFLNAREAAKSIADGLSTFTGSNIDMATIIYSETAKVLKDKGKIFYSVNDGETGDLKDLIDSSYEIKEGCNLGDGLRLGYHTLKEGIVEDRNEDGVTDSDDVVLEKAATEKYLIVFSYNEPTMYTKDGSSYKSDNKEVSKSDGTDAVQALEYANEISKTIKTEGFDKVYFIDINNKVAMNPLTVGVADKAGAEVHDPLSLSENSDVVKSILKDLTFKPVVKGVTAKFKTNHKLPADVELVEDTPETLNKNNFKLNGDEFELIDGTYDLNPSPDNTEAKISDLYMNVKFNRITDSETVTTDTKATDKKIVDPIKFDETELIYTFKVTTNKDTNKDGIVDEDDEDVIPVGVPVNELLVKVLWNIDIN